MRTFDEICSAQNFLVFFTSLTLQRVRKIFSPFTLMRDDDWVLVNAKSDVEDSRRIAVSVAPSLPSP